ncbi:MAG TPA: hypothetical protein VJ903_04715 [Clostridia bacterium]|nr:hypothetical protein [Clostridia bacterium]
MSEFEVKPVKLIIVIVDRNMDKKVTNLFNENNIEYHIALLGKGTAPTDIKTYFGLDEKEKSVIISIAEEQEVKNVFGLLKTELHFDEPNTGIAFTVKIGSLSSMMALQYLTGFLENKEEN